ncbi:MAG TPA: hypothetical protein VG755_10700, partial [Nannocystaceae bacterium]|nr:hypothetical protein [Nannocystaceae bacterium]
VWLVLTGELGVRTTAVLVGGWSSKLAIAAAGGLAVIAIGGATAQAVPSDPQPPIAAAIVPIAAPREPAPMPAEPCVTPPPIVETAVAAPIEAPRAAKPTHVAKPNKSAPPAQPAAPAPTSTPTVDDMKAESAVLKQAREALRDHDPQRALALLEEHRRRFPDGVLALERRAAWTRAKCAAGDGDAARAEAKRLLAEHPSDPVAVGVRDVCTTKSSAP